MTLESQYKKFIENNPSCSTWTFTEWLKYHREKIVSDFNKLAELDNSQIESLEKESNADFSEDWKKKYLELKSLIVGGSEQIIGNVQEAYNSLQDKEYDWRSFYHGWLESRVDINELISNYEKQNKIKSRE
jgi:hypothetical protein